MPYRSVASFDTIRSWEGSQSRAFEELAYQLLKSEVPAGSHPVRTGNPDGGVEWYARLNDGSEWGWQAKHIHGIDALLTAMKESVRRIAQERPDISRLIFVISLNLATSTRGRTRKSQRQKYEDAVATWKATIAGAANIEFKLVQGSDLLDRLALPEHRARAWFWWAEPVFTPSWFQSRLTEEADAAGDKYRPDLQVDLPIEDDLKALGFDSSVVSEFERLRHAVVSASQDLWLTPRGPTELKRLYRKILKTGKVLRDVATRTVLQPASAAEAIKPLSTALARYVDAVREAEGLEYRLAREWRELPPDHPDREAKKPPDEARHYGVRELSQAADALDSWMESSPGQVLLRGLYFLVGPAGSGKTHLFLDAVDRALKDDRPAVVLAGARFGRGDFWGTVCDQLGLEPLGSDILLGAMDAAGEASAHHGRRFVILIDALNETTAPDFWATHLPALRAAVARWPHVALAISCRDTYLEAVDQGHERSKYIQATHPGFAGREVEATQRYFEHYGLEAPRLPLLVPEFTLPLFLRLYCESLSGDSRNSDEGHEGRVRIFQRYLDAKLVRVARRLRPGAATSYELQRATDMVVAVVDAFLDEFAATGQEGTTRHRGEELAISALSGSSEDAAIVLGGLQSEGVLTGELLYLGSDKTQDGFRIVFQAFADFLILRRRLATISDPVTDISLHHWLLDECSFGIIEAATVALPEMYGIELPDLLGISEADVSADSDQAETQERANRARRILRTLVKTLPYRESTAVTDRAVELLNESRRVVSSQEVFRTILQMAPQPDNQLNGDRLHGHLVSMRMPRRDAYFGFAMYREIWDESTPAAILARWASRGPYPSYDPRVVELACIPLVWLLSSPNRFMRDWVTKSLVQLLHGHLDVARSLLDRFWTVDDPYVVQRIVVIAYGALMRSDPTDTTNARNLSQRVRRLVFARPMRADELLLDAGRGVVEWAVSRRLLPRAALRDIERPYGFAPPSIPPTQATLDLKYGFKESQPEEESYSSIWSSLLSLGDFGRYVVESGVDHFSRHRLDGPYPEGPLHQEPRFSRRRWNAFVRSLSSDQVEDLKRLDVDPDSAGWQAFFWGPFRSGLNGEQSTLLDAVWSQPRRRPRDDDYPAGRARRWVFRRTLSLGWRPQLFGAEDRTLGRGQGRQAHKAERWGKKYQWMAYHELLARIADNFHAARRFDDSRPYEGLHQMMGERKIDPSVPPVEYRAFAEDIQDAPSWRPSPISIPSWPPVPIDFRPYRGDVAAFIADRQNEPSLDRIMVVIDGQGERWVLLDTYISQGDPSADKEWRGLQQPFALDSWFAPRSLAADLMPHLASLRRADRADLIDEHGHVDCCYAGEIGWSPHHCYHCHRDYRTIEVGGRSWKLANAVEAVSWEGSLADCSINETVFAAMPSSFVHAKANLVLDERGPSFADGGEVVFTNYDPTGARSQRALLVKGTWLSRFLRKHELELLVSSWYERRIVREMTARRSKQPDPWENVYAAARVDADLNVHVSTAIREPDSEA